VTTPKNGEPTRADMQGQIDDLRGRHATDRQHIDRLEEQRVVDRELIAHLEGEGVLDRELITRLEIQGVVDRDRIANLETALISARRIGAAMGILMNRYQMTDEQAFDALRVASQHRHRKLRDVAEDVIMTGVLDLT
jgi:hypothetical protein